MTQESLEKIKKRKTTDARTLYLHVFSRKDQQISPTTTDSPIIVYEL